MSKEATAEKSEPQPSNEGGQLIKGRYGASNLPLDYLLDWSAPKFWASTITETPEQVIALANELDIDAVRKRAGLPGPVPPTSRASPPPPADDEKEKSKRQRTLQHTTPGASK